MPFADDRCAYSFVSFGAAAVDTLLVNCLSTQIIAKKRHLRNISYLCECPIHDETLGVQ